MTNSFILILSSPSGAGKTSLARKVLEQDHSFKTSVSVTTRQKRSSEIEGKDYFFVNKEQFEQMLKEEALLEHALVFGNLYGSPKTNALELLNAGYNVIFDIDWQGARLIKKQLNELTVSIFILPPSIAELKKRLEVRGEDNEEIITRRMEAAKIEISHYDEYDYVVVNDDFNTSLETILNIIKIEKLKRQNFASFIESLVK